MKINNEKIKIFNLFTIIMSNNETFDSLDFFKYIDFIPFDEEYHDKVLEKIEEYFSKDSAIYRIIGNYMDNNYIDNIKPINFNKLYDQEVYVNNELVTNEKVDKVLEIINLSNYPKINYVYGTVLVRYLNNEIDLDKLRTKVKIKKNFSVCV